LIQVSGARSPDEPARDFPELIHDFFFAHVGPPPEPTRQNPNYVSIYERLFVVKGT
jgi:hypothetical protein